MEVVSDLSFTSNVEDIFNDITERQCGHAAGYPVHVPPEEAGLWTVGKWEQNIVCLLFDCNVGYSPYGQQPV